MELRETDQHWSAFPGTLDQCHDVDRIDQHWAPRVVTPHVNGQGGQWLEKIITPKKYRNSSKKYQLQILDPQNTTGPPVGLDGE